MSVVVRRQVGEIVPFAMIGDDGRSVPAAEAFLSHLVLWGRATYTVRLYALGLADFLSWVEERGVALAEVDRPLLAGYAADFRFGTKVAWSKCIRSGLGRCTR